MSGSDDSDEWAVDDLPDLPAASKKDVIEQQLDVDDGEGWEQKLAPSNETTKKKADPVVDEGFPMIIVDMTQLSKDIIHSKFDANAVNDPAAVKKLRLEIEADYETYSKNSSDLVADGTVIPCGSSVWRLALERLRKERQGHYFCPIFPPKK